MEVLFPDERLYQMQEIVYFLIWFSALLDYDVILFFDLVLYSLTIRISHLATHPMFTGKK